MAKPQFDYETALVRNKLSDEELDALIDLLPETTSALEISLRLNLPQKLVRKSLEDPATLKALIARTHVSNVQWFKTVAIERVKAIVNDTKDPELVMKGLKLLADWLGIEELHRRGRSPGRPKNPAVNVGVQVNNPGSGSYEDAVRGGGAVATARLLPEGDSDESDESDDDL